MILSETQAHDLVDLENDLNADDYGALYARVLEAQIRRARLESNESLICSSKPHITLGPLQTNHARHERV